MASSAPSTKAIAIGIIVAIVIIITCGGAYLMFRDPKTDALANVNGEGENVEPLDTNKAVESGENADENDDSNVKKGDESDVKKGDESVDSAVSGKVTPTKETSAFWKFWGYKPMTKPTPKRAPEQKPKSARSASTEHAKNNEIDELFSALSAKRDCKSDAHESTQKPASKRSRSEPDQKTRRDDATLNTDEESGLDSVFESGSEDEAVTLNEGVHYDPQRDDFQLPPAATGRDKDDGFFDSRGTRRKTRPLTDDGLPIYTAKELRVGLGGGTVLCPFDCNCCY